MSVSDIRDNARRSPGVAALARATANPLHFLPDAGRLRMLARGVEAGKGGQMMFEHCTWLNEPPDWNLQGGVLNVTTGASTDFWRETHYGFTRDSGHFFHIPAAGDFTASLRVQARYDELYDQAGLMIRIDAANWVKAGVELSDGKPWLSSVLTRGRSDWATGVFDGDATDFRLRATVKSGVLRLQVSADGRLWRLLRLAPFPRAESYAVGPMCCTPERAGLRVRFSEFSVGPALEKGLHDLS